MRSPNRRVERVAGLALLAVLASSCGRIAAGVARGGGPNQSAAEMLADDVELSGGTEFRVLANETRPGGSSALGVYIGQMEFEEPGVLEPAECWSYQLVVQGNGGSASGVGGCIKAGLPVPPGGDWGWGSDEPNRILGSVDSGWEVVEVRYLDGTTERFVPLRATAPFTRAFFAVQLEQPVAQVEDLVEATD